MRRLVFSMTKLITIVGALFFASLVSSCGGSGGTSEKEVVKEEQCDCKNLFMDPTTYKWQKGSKLYTGTCETKDQYDVVTQHLELKNGFKVFQLIKQKVAGKYLTVDSVYYDGLNPVNGFTMHIMASGLGTYVDEFRSYVNGVEESGKIDVNSSSSTVVSADGMGYDVISITNATIIYDKGSRHEFITVEDKGPGFVKEFTDKAKAISNKFQVFEIH